MAFLDGLFADAGRHELGADAGGWETGWSAADPFGPIQVLTETLRTAGIWERRFVPVLSRESTGQVSAAPGGVFV